MLPKLSETKLIEWNMHMVAKQSMNYDKIFGQDILEELGMVFNFKTKQRTWNEVSIPMRSISTFTKEGYYINDSAVIAEATARTTKIFEAHYEAADIDQILSTC